jgi:ribosome-associated protein YbcJ (S4-like RNA binding protein)
VQEEKMEIITLREDYIKLGQALKAAGDVVCYNGNEIQIKK